MPNLTTGDASLPGETFQRVCDAVNYLMLGKVIPGCLHYRVARHRASGKWVVVMWCNGADDHDPDAKLASHSPFPQTGYPINDVIHDGEVEAKKMRLEQSPLLYRSPMISVPRSMLTNKELNRLAQQTALKKVKKSKLQ